MDGDGQSSHFAVKLKNAHSLSVCLSLFSLTILCQQVHCVQHAHILLATKASSIPACFRLMWDNIVFILFKSEFLLVIERRLDSLA